MVLVGDNHNGGLGRSHIGTVEAPHGTRPDLPGKNVLGPIYATRYLDGE
jgi:hypothetical protein